MPYPTGLSSEAIQGRGKDHPHDPADLLRCINYCKGYLSTEQLQKRMAGRSPEWDRLLPHWDSLVSLLEGEMATRTDGTAPATYIEMKRILADGVKCTGCDGTGRGIECDKCKGTGRRSGGRCRAIDCWRGAHLCPTCRGRGFTDIKEN